MTFNDRTTPLSLLSTRRSGKPRNLAEPGPDDAELAQMIAIAARTPDHGKLSPWRFVIVPAEARDALADALVAALKADRPDASDRDAEEARAFAHYAPALVVVLSVVEDTARIPAWEQELSAGAVCMNLLHAAHAMGYHAGWLTSWAAFSDRVRDLFAPAPARIAGFMFVGTSAHALEERPRMDPAALTTRWNPKGGL
ncbi:MAG: nitroreductase family protein [Pseudomonadota bacterium]